MNKSMLKSTNDQAQIFFFTSDILETLRVSYVTYWRRIKRNPNLSHIIQKGKRKEYYTNSERELIIQNFLEE